MKSFSKPILMIGLMAITLLGSGCFDVLEEIFIRKDGSGTIKTTWSYESLAKLLDGMKQGVKDAMEEKGETPDEDDTFGEFELSDSFDELVENTRKIPGIRDVVNLSSEEDYTLSYSFSFDNIEALNRAMNRNKNSMASVTGSDEKAPKNDQPRFEFDGKRLNTTADFELSEEAKGEEANRNMMKSFYSNNSYVIQYRFEQEVKKVKNNDAALKGSDMQSALIEIPMSDLLFGEAKLDNQIILRK